MPNRGKKEAMSSSAWRRAANLTNWAVRDIRRRGEAEPRGSRKVWLAAAFAPPFGPRTFI
jgi:hypothetical protein